MNKEKHKQKNKGFTLVETMVAVFILTISLTAFFGVVASSLFSARYANNEITATYLLQEAVDYIRNDRDSSYQASGSAGWTNFKAKYQTGGCFGGEGCQFEPAAGASSLITSCPNGSSGNFGTINCQLFNYDPNGTHHDFYTYDTNFGSPSKFKRRIKMYINLQNNDEVDLIVTVEWQNGNLTRSQSLATSLLDWRKNLW